MKWNRQTIVFTAVGAVVFSYLLSFIFNCYFTHGFDFVFDAELLLDGKTFIYSGVLLMSTGLVFLAHVYKHYWEKRARKIVKGSRERTEGNLEQSHFQSEKEQRANFRCYDFRALPAARSGVPVKAQYTGKGLDIMFAEPCHALIIGTTGSGKTSAFISPTIQLLAICKDKPSMLVSDPKGELYSLHVGTLRKKGYNVATIDLRNPFSSTRWNPLTAVYDSHEKARNETDRQKAQVFDDEAYDLLHDIACGIAPITNKEEPVWESGARNFILAVLLAMLDDARITKEKYIFHNLARIASQSDAEIKSFFSHCKSAQARQLAKQVLDATDKTRASYISTIMDKLHQFADTAICAITSENEVNFADLINKPTVLFLQVPDEKSTRHPLASLFISQAYKNLVAIAGKNPGNKLARPVFFILDEFGNLPAVNNIEQMITAGRSRNIWFFLVVQSYTQISNVYGDKVADIVKSNCNVQVFIGTNDIRTTEEFSKLCGNYTVDSNSVGYSTAHNDISPSVALRERPLIYPSELATLNEGKNNGNMIISVFGYSPLKTTFTPYYKMPVYGLKAVETIIPPPRTFDVEKVELSLTAVPPSKQAERPRQDIKRLLCELPIEEEKRILLCNLHDKGNNDKLFKVLAAVALSHPETLGKIEEITTLLNR